MRYFVLEKWWRWYWRIEPCGGGKITHHAGGWEEGIGRICSVDWNLVKGVSVEGFPSVQIWV